MEMTLQLGLQTGPSCKLTVLPQNT